MSSRRSDLRLVTCLAMTALAGCNGAASSPTTTTDVTSPGASADGGGGSQGNACIEQQRAWVLERVPESQRADVEGTIRALLQDRDALVGMPSCTP